MASALENIAHLVVRHVRLEDEDDHAVVACPIGNEYNGNIGVRISAIFVILITSTVGAWFPVFADRHKGVKVPETFFFLAKFFGSGVILATPFIHLLPPAHETLGHECLTGPITEYPWVEAIALMSIFTMFFLELVALRSQSAAFKAQSRDEEVARSQVPDDSIDKGDEENRKIISVSRTDMFADSYGAQLTSIFILEFGIIFHSIFIGLTLAVSGDEFNTLYVVLVFHQLFEGLGLGARLAGVPWPESKKWTPYVFAVGYGLSTPLALAIGLGVRNSYSPGSKESLMVNGIFDSISSGILIYTGLVELIAHEFLYCQSMLQSRFRRVLSAFGLTCLGALLMSVLGKWA